MSLLCRRRYRSLLSAARADLDDADRRLSHVLLSSDTLYATRDTAWQEGPEGKRHCAASDKLRVAVLALRGLDLPQAEELA